MYKTPDIVKVIKFYLNVAEYKPLRVTTEKLHTLSIECFYDDDFSANRYSYTIVYQGGTHASGGYGNNNEISYPTMDSAIESAIESICGFDREQYKEIIREIRLNTILDEGE